MRTIRSVLTGLALLSLLPAAAMAQDGRPFENSWFWGVKGGAMTVRTGLESTMAPVVGVDWFITRTRAGLYIAVEQGFFDDVRGVVMDPTTDTGLREVELKNFRRASFSLLAFPADWGMVRPYAGIGHSLHLVQRATPLGGFASEQGAMDVLVRIEDRRSRTSWVFMGGVQAAFGNAALFGQATAMPTGGRFLLSGDDNLFLLEAGLRFNVGSAIERVDRR
jgi:opacity protein-like surface antigen